MKSLPPTSVRNLDLRLSAQAREDYRDILLYAYNTYGLEQANTYARGLLDAMRNLAAYPHIGPGRDTGSQNTRSRVYQSHRITYRLSNTEILVVRILHVRRDPSLLDQSQ